MKELPFAFFVVNPYSRKAAKTQRLGMKVTLDNLKSQIESIVNQPNPAPAPKGDWFA